MIGAEIDGKTVAVYPPRRQGLRNRRHLHARVCESGGRLSRRRRRSSAHCTRRIFDVRTGKALSAPAVEDLKTYPVKVDGDDILIDLDGTGG